MHQGKKIHKKKTSTKKAERGPIFNEAMIFSVPAHTLSVSTYHLLHCFKVRNWKLLIRISSSYSGEVNLATVPYYR